MRHRIIVGLGMAALAAGCGDAGRDAAPTGDTPDNASVNYQAALENMPEGQRNAVFIRAIQDARLDCQHVESSTRAADYQGRPVWNARCAGGGNWTIVVGEDGTASVLNANEAQLLDQGNTQ